MKQEPIYKPYVPTINYQSESTDITRYCCSFVLEHDFHKNSTIENIFLLEKAMEIYSFEKIIGWKKRKKEEIKLEDIESWMTLDGITQKLDSQIPTEKEKYDFFIQYIYNIIYILGEMNKTHMITDQEQQYLKQIITIKKNNITITEIIPNPQIPIHEIPSKIIKVLKNIYIVEKDPILKK